MGKIIYLAKDKKGGKSNMSDMREYDVRSNIIDVAKCFLSFESMQHKKIQKLCYYAYGILLAMTDGRIKLFDDSLEAWVHGPVSPTLYREYKSCGMYGTIKKDTCPKYIKEDVFIYTYLKRVYDTIGVKYTSDELEEMTHQELPWIKARKGLKKYEYSDKKISDKDIIEYFS